MFQSLSEKPKKAVNGGKASHCSGDSGVGGGDTNGRVEDSAKTYSAVLAGSNRHRPTNAAGENTENLSMTLQDLDMKWTKKFAELETTVDSMLNQVNGSADINENFGGQVHGVGKQVMGDLAEFRVEFERGLQNLAKKVEDVDKVTKNSDTADLEDRLANLENVVRNRTAFGFSAVYGENFQNEVKMYRF